MPYTGIMRGILKGRLAGLVATRSMFTGQVQLAGTDTETTVIELYTTAIFTPILPYISTIWTVETVEIQHWITGEGWVSIREDPFTLVGSGTGDASPNLVAAVLVAKVSGFHLLGRKFISGVTEAATNLNTLTTVALAAFASAAAIYFDTFTTPQGSVFGPGVVAKDGSFHAFSSGFVSALLGTMRRRKPGLGI